MSLKNRARLAFIESVGALLRSAERLPENPEKKSEFESDLRKAQRHLQLATQAVERLLYQPEETEKKEMEDTVSRIVGHQMDGLNRQNTGKAVAAKPSAKSTSPTAGGLQGDTQTISLAELINWLGLQEKDGVLHIQTSNETVTMYFEMGNLIHALSSNSPPKARLGELLVEMGVIEKKQLDDFFQRYSSSRERLGAALEREELVNKDDLRIALEKQVQALFNRLFQAEKASFTFQEGLPPDADRRIRLNVTHLVLESARMHDEAHATEDDREDSSGL